MLSFRYDIFVFLRDVFDHIDGIKLGSKWSKMGIAFRFQSLYNLVINSIRN